VQRLARGEREQRRVEQRLVVRGDDYRARRDGADDLDPVEQPRRDERRTAERQVQTYAQKRSSSPPTNSA
jgi:hypothetical protein